MFPPHPIAALPAGWDRFSCQAAKRVIAANVVRLRVPQRDIFATFHEKRRESNSDFPLAHRFHANFRQQRSGGDTRSGAGAVYASARERFSAGICCVAGVLSPAAALLIGGGTPASAAECSILQDTGTVASLTNSDPNPPNDQCIHVTNGAGVTGDVTNTGKLTGINTHHTGIIIDQGASVGGSIINSGTISQLTILEGKES